MYRLVFTHNKKSYPNLEEQKATSGRRVGQVAWHRLRLFTQLFGEDSQYIDLSLQTRKGLLVYNLSEENVKSHISYTDFDLYIRQQVYWLIPFTESHELIFSLRMPLHVTYTPRTDCVFESFRNHALYAGFLHINTRF